MATIVGHLKALLSLDSASYTEGMKRARKDAKRTADSMNKLKDAAKLLAGSLVFAETARTVVQFEKLEASLRVVTGSAEKATARFNELKNFAATTPYQLQDVTESFIKLKALGLDPSIGSLRSFGNTAAAMGKPMMDFIEAVADASTGEFERLKEFGIKASKQGEEVAFTFQGTTTRVKNSAADIQRYLKEIGNNQFAGAMEEQMDTLGGAFSNLQDSTAQLMDAVGKAGLSSALQTAAAAASNLATVITAGVSPSKEAAAKAKEMSEGYKIFAFTVFKLKQEFVDLGDVIGAAAAIASRAAVFDFDGVDFILEERKRKRAQLEKDAQDFVARMNGIYTGLGQPEQTGGTGPGGGGGSPTPTPEPAAGANPLGSNEKLREKLAGRMQALREQLASEEQQLAISFAKRWAIIQEAENSKVGTESEWRELRLQAQEEYQRRLTEIEKAGWSEREKFAAMSLKRQAATVFGEMAGITAGVAQHNKALFEINKTAGIANAVIGAHEGASRTLAKYPWPLGPALAALHYAAGAARVQAIRSTSFQGGGGGTTPSAAGTAATINSQAFETQQIPQKTQERDPEPVVNININGDSYGTEELQDKIVEAYREAIERDRL